jgi:hypothetical protein
LRDGSDLVTIATTDAPSPFSNFGLAAINNVGTVAFVASLRAGGTGIFIGPDPVSDRVVKTGDSILGLTLASISFLRGGLNDHGQIAFFARFSGGVSGVVRADPP